MCVLAQTHPTSQAWTVDGQEVNGNYFINNSQEVNVSCYFEKGNPPAVFRLLLKNGTELISSHDEEHLHHILTAECEDDWPMVRCEGNGTQENKSVIFLVRCPPQFVDVSTQIYTTYARDIIELPVKAHTTLLTACFLTAVSSQDITKRNMRCTLHGKPPDLKLHLHPDTEAITQGNWTLTLRNEIGSTTTTIRVLGSLNSTASPPKAALPTNVTTALMCGFVVTFVTIVVVSIIVVRNVKRQRHEVAGMKSTSGNLQGNSSTMIVNDLIEASGEADSNNIVDRSPVPPTSSEVPPRPLRSRLPTGDTQSDARNSSSETSENVYVSARKVREKKQIQKKDRETYVAESSHTATNAAETSPHPDPEKKPPCNRNADGLIYGDLIFTNTKLSKVIIGTEEKTEYTEIQVTSPRLQTAGNKKIEARNND
ncbi:uncharacterized protein LOC112568789 isoform X2 [Pomacea canaliculata]|uniref:uncharacterized protein LOC112568789 isoform X2 n=1 Tax=Pomacea canaliculata TaxID=400727 RepID=UPI000D73F7E7|nr:uncharacterized protein LOC112568789 isoform X2 [Pomacea canaliculata]